MDKNSFIGVFDSGVGGLGVVNTLLKILPTENYLYVADSSNYPYGTKTEEEIKKFSERVVRHLIGKNVKAIVVACNTVSSVAIPMLKEIAGEIPVFGMIQSGSKLALRVSENLKIGVISTPLTAKSHAYKKEILRLNKNAEVLEVGSQELVNLVEDGNQSNKYAYTLAQRKLSGIIESGADTLILGCTHFPFLYKVVKKVVGNDMKIVDPAYGVGNELKNYLQNRNLLSESEDPTRLFFTTGDKQTFLEKAKIFLNIDVKNVKHLDI